MFKKVSVLIPTRHRLERLRMLLLSYERTTEGVEHASELIFRVDDDDHETQDFLSSARGLIIGPRLQGYRSMVAFFNEMAVEATGDVLMCGNDDMVFRTPGWAPLVLTVANRFPDGLFDIGVSTLNEDHYPFATVSKLAAEHMGFLWDPRIFWGDIFLRDVMGAFGRNVKLPLVQIDHEWAGFKPDAVFLEEDKGIPANYWSEIHSTAVNDAVVKLKELAVLYG